MYAFYADESGFSKGGNLEADQPITVVAGVLIDLTKLPKAIRIFDKTLDIINRGNPEKSITELKFSDIRQGKGVFRKNFPKIEARADLLKSVMEEFEHEIAFKIFYTAVVDEKFIEAKKNETYSKYVKQGLHHSYLCAAYRVLTLLEVYFGKSQHSKMIQIADLIAGMLRYYFWRVHMEKTADYWFVRIQELVTLINKNVIERECFKDKDLRELYEEICIKKASPK